jgi:hypothetical protein
MTNMNYQQAFEAVRSGKRVRRPSWEYPWEHVVHVSRILDELVREEDGTDGFYSGYGDLLRLVVKPSPLGDWDQVQVFRYHSTKEDLVADDWELFEFPSEWTHMEHQYPFK